MIHCFGIVINIEGKGMRLGVVTSMTQGRKSLDNKIVYVVSEFGAVLLVCQPEVIEVLF